MLATIQAKQTAPIAIAETTEQMIGLWLHGKSKNTINAYRRDIYEFLTFAGGVELGRVTLNHLHNYETALGELGRSPNTIARKLAAVKSLLTFAHRIGVVGYNAGALVQTKPDKDKLSERILSHGEVLDMIYSTENQRDRLLLKMLYATGARVSELCRLTWDDIKSNGDGTTRVTLFGKGDKTRVLLIDSGLYAELKKLNVAGKLHLGAKVVFRSRKGAKALTRGQVFRIVKQAASRAGIE
uniref:tyrosine-type recombinase/integrase n=1 Tax=Synechococcus sp. BDU 130192 TaxID=2042059 RepID=UPI000C082D84